MDSLTQLALGAAVGYAVGGKKYGKKAILMGAAAGTLPDLDILPILPFDNEFIYLKHHRGFSHSLIFAVLTPLLVLRKSVTLAWTLFACFATHILLDCFTTWGTQVFWPLANRVAWNTIFIVDPMYTVPILLSLILALLASRHALRSQAIWIGLGLSSLYLVWTLGIKTRMHYEFKMLFATHGLEIQRFMTRPTAFNSILWSTTAESKDGYYFGMISLLDRSFQGPLYFLPKNHDLASGFSDKESQELLAYTKGYYSVESIENGVRVHDLRYGFMGDPWVHGPQYVFSYDLTKDDGGAVALEIQNPRPENTADLMGELWVRLKGI